LVKLYTVLLRVLSAWDNPYMRTSIDDHITLRAILAAVLFYTGRCNVLHLDV